MNKVVVFAFGRMNPVTTGHLRLVREIVDVARKNKADAKFYPTRTPLVPQTGRHSKNPLTATEKIRFIKSAFKNENIHIVDDPTLKTWAVIIQKLATMGYEKIIYVHGVSSDDKEQQEMATRMKKEAEKYKMIFQTHELRRSGGGVNGMSATKVREAAAKGDYAKFAEGMVNKKDAKELYLLLVERMMPDH